MLDLDFVRDQFPALALPANRDQAFFENAGGSFACRQTIDALHEYYTSLKVQPYADFDASRTAGEKFVKEFERLRNRLAHSQPLLEECWDMTLLLARHVDRFSALLELE